MSIGNNSEEEPLTLSELRALAAEYDRQAKLASKAIPLIIERGGASQARAKRREVPEKDLLALGGKKTGSDIIFGTDGETQLIFRPSKGRFEGAARWTVSLKGNISHYDTQRELNKANRELWDKEKGEPSVAFKAAEQLLACHVEELRACQVEVRTLHELNERPETETVMEQVSKMSEQLNRVSEQLIMAQDAISLVVEALSKELGGKLQIAFDMLRDDSQWPRDIERLRWHATVLACDLQRPPSKKELKQRHDPDRRIDPSPFAELLKSAGLSWLPRARPE
jgi:hypothetical protein